MVFAMTKTIIMYVIMMVEIVVNPMKIHLGTNTAQIAVALRSLLVTQ